MTTSSQLAKGWNQASVYSRTFGRLCDGTVAAVLDGIPSPGDSGPGRLSRSQTLLDVGAGPGRLACEASERGWSVTAVDPEQEMLAAAAAQAPEVTCVQASLPHLPFADASFDAVVANFVVNHLADPRAGVTEMVRVLRPGGDLVVTAWPSELTAVNRLWADVVDQAQVEQPTGLRLPEELDFPRTEGGLGALLAATGLEVRTSTSTWCFEIAPDLLWSGVEAGIASIGATFLSQDHDGRARMRAAYRRIVAEACGTGPLRLPSSALVARGTAKA